MTRISREYIRVSVAAGCPTRLRPPPPRRNNASSAEGRGELSPRILRILVRQMFRNRRKHFFSKRKTARLEGNYSTEATRSTRERESAASINDRGGKRWSVEPARKWRPNRYGPEFTALHSRGEERSPRHRPQWTGLL